MNWELQRNETFAAKMKITEEQQKLLNEINMQRSEYFRSLQGGGGRGFGGPPSEETLAKMKEFEAATMNVLTAEQKEVWEARKTEVKAEQAAKQAENGEGGGGRPDRRDARPDSASNSGGGSTQPAARRMNFTDEKPPEGATVTATFGRC